MISTRKLLFSNKAKIRFYNNIAMLLENRVQIVDSIAQLLTIMEKGNRNSSTEAKVARSCYNAMVEGLSFSEGLQDWVTPSELAIISAGEISGTLDKALHDVINLINSLGKIRSALTGAIVYPVVLIIMLSVLLHIISDSLVPKLAAVSSPETWEGAAYALYKLAGWTSSYGVIMLIGLIIGVIYIVISLPLMTGKIRIWLDKIPPWSLYKDINGCVFLLNLSMLLKSGVRLHECFEILQSRAESKWLSSRLVEISNGISDGLSLGEAMDESPYTFPDEESICYMQLLCNMSGFERALGSFAAHWLENTVMKVKKAAASFLLMAIIAMGCTLGLVVQAISGIESAIQQSVM
ncbi:hypothetical protein J3704_004151 [Salmonella enterica subsp. diarizonae serovar 61:z52:z53]|nr:hypothetical protein [Salmonella enterica subsp. diarizonae serovar 53:r:z35]EHG6069909.1 hypothetical protein [Salmonella enterica subsp. diarizonae serovar 61:z52:z53]EHG6221093.1 hypothetical protein [Salmonella enterica subsp. diarizonae serovar 61:z52:z53]ELV5048438.1 type II secretion system F family protein [Salmonella enterica]